MPRDMAETLARSALYKLLSVAFLPPSERAPELFSGIDRILDLLPVGHQAILRPIVQEVAVARSGATGPEYTRLFGVGLAATPYETEYDPLASARKGHRLADLLGFYEAFGVRIADHRKEFPDHVAAELEFMALLFLKAAHAGAEAMEEALSVSEEAAVKFMADHLGAWGGIFADRVERATGEGFYRFAARLLRGFLLAECRLLGVEPLTLAAAPPRDADLPTCPFAGECPTGDLAIEYEPRLIEEAVFCAIRGRREETAFRAERDRLYEIGDPEAREAGFRAFHASWFERLGLGAGIAEALGEQPSVAAGAARCLVATAPSSGEEGAELFVSSGNGPAGARGRTLLIRLKPVTLTLPDRLRSLLRHELLHIADMLDPRFGYEPRLPPSAAAPASERLLRERYRVLWDAYIDGRLAVLGRAPAGARAARLGEFTRAFPALGEVAEAAFDRFFGAATLSHGELVAFAVEPEAVLRPPSNDREPDGSAAAA